jgi:glutamyl-tRNA reductase
MTLLAIGLNHQTTPLDVRSKFAFEPAQLGSLLTELLTRFSAVKPEAALLSTCNRTELYLASTQVNPIELAPTLLDWLAIQGQIRPAILEQHTYTHVAHHAARHAFRVASGLDSMVIGEPQILGQLKQAVRLAHTHGSLGTTLHQLFQRSFAVAKEVRSSTEVGAHSISMAAASVRLAAQLFESLSDIRVLLIGAGEMIELVATHFAAKHPKAMVVANRTLERAEKLALRFHGQAMRLADIPLHLHEFDAVISCTASSLPIIGLGAVEKALQARKHRPMFMVDLAVPRDIEPQVAELKDVYHYSVDDLSCMVQQGQQKRQAAVDQAEAIIDSAVIGFGDWIEQRSIVPYIQTLQEHCLEWKKEELAKAQKRLLKGEKSEEVLNAMGQALIQKMLHGAMVELNSSHGAQRDELMQLLNRLFLRHNDQ